MTETPRIIDVHRHAQPLECAELMLSTGPAAQGGSGIPAAALALLGGMDVEATLAEFDDCGIDAAILQSYGSHTLAEGERRVELAQLTNDFFAGLIEQAPSRLGAAASLPLPDVDAALAEIERSADRVGLDAVGLNTSYAGQYLGDPGFDLVLDELDRRGSVVIVHPNPPLGVHLMHLDFPALHLELPFDTTRAIANMLVHNVFERYQGIRFVIPHAGGVAPYLQMRLAVGLAATPASGVAGMPDAMARVQGALRSLYFDVAVSTSIVPLSTILQAAGPGNILFGSDCPPGPREQLEATIGAVGRFEPFEGDVRSQVHRENALELFPRLAKV